MLTFLLLFKTTTCRRSAWIFSFILALVTISGCSSSPKQEVEPEEEAIARTEFTDRIENFFEYEPLKAGKQSQFLIHLTDLSDGTPVENAEVTLTTRAKGGAEVMQTKARVGKVTGIYVADVAIPSGGDYEIEFHVKNAKVDERLSLSDFKVE
ncbi:MAG: FixH family protein [Acidobacteriota bacterium]|nr:FixH family protein [Acidobacteriota bacterium]